MTYCEAAPNDPIHAYYHEFEYGFPVNDDDALFERLMLEVNQAGLSWRTVLVKRENFSRAFAGWRIDAVAEFGEDDVARLLADSGIIRNRIKVRAAIENARRIAELRRIHGSFRAWLDVNHPKSLDEWRKLFKKTFVFTGGEIVNEFLMSTGYLAGAHHEGCPVFAQILSTNPPWLRKSESDPLG
jgi:DNA-3-methyladenine glycosylase I